MLATICKLRRILGRTAACGGVMLAVFSSGCGERLRRSDAPAAPPDAPLAKINVTLDQAKIDADHKYTANGQFTVSGLFYKDNESTDATVLVAVHDDAGKLSRTYDFDYAGVASTTAKVEMWDGGFLTVVVPKGGADPQFQTSNPNIKAVGVALPAGESTCYFAKGTVDGDLRLALCALETPTPSLRFVDAAGIPASPPSGEGAPAAPAAGAAEPTSPVAGGPVAGGPVAGGPVAGSPVAGSPAPAELEPAIPEGPAKKKP